MIRRLPLTLSALALAISLTGVGAADAVRAVKQALFAQNAGAVNGIKASRTPRPGRLLPLDRHGHLPGSVLAGAARGPRGPQGPPGPAGTVSNPYAFRAHAVAAQDTPVHGSMRVLLGGEDFDLHGDFDAGSSTYAAPIDGTYLFTGAVAMSGAATGRTFAQLTSSRAGMRIRGDDDSATPFHVAVVSGLMHLRRGDTVELDLYTDQANTVIATEALTQLSGVLVAADH